MLNARGAVIRTWSDEVFNWKGAVVFGLLALFASAIPNASRGTFGLSGFELFLELGMAATVFVTFGIAITALGARLARLLGLRTRRNWLLAAIAVAPITFFLVGAHLAMSQALAPLKREFSVRSAVISGDETDFDGNLDAVLVRRDAMLRQYGYLHLGSWRADSGKADCSSVYLFMGTF
ncbi:MAG: hypothetical protein PHS79_01640 [Patescibacteria group bacterium]|nr:hypothetical protein [Patescibacteria group bacterium]